MHLWSVAKHALVNFVEGSFFVRLILQSVTNIQVLGYYYWALRQDHF